MSYNGAISSYSNGIAFHGHMAVCTNWHSLAALAGGAVFLKCFVVCKVRRKSFTVSDSATPFYGSDKDDNLGCDITNVSRRNSRK